MDRQAAASLVRVIRPGDHLVIWKMDRVSRRMVDNLHALEFFAKQEINVYILNFNNGESLDLTTAVGKMVIQLLSMVNEFERNMISERTKEAMAYRRSLGLPTGGQPKYGYRREVDKDSKGKTVLGSLRLVRDEGEIAQIYELWKRKHHGGESCRQIAIDWIKKGYMTADGVPWTRSRVLDVYNWYDDLMRHGKGAL
jgi:DNA invertase Pin-like site-specific DNA recombinase